MELDIKNLLLTSSQNLRNADLIVNAAKLAEQELKYKVLFALKKELKQSFNWECIDNDLSYGENSKASNPGISYYLCPIPNTGLELFFRIEIDYRDLFAGFYIAENKKCSSAAMKYSKEFNSPITSVPLRRKHLSYSYKSYRYPIFTTMVVWFDAPKKSRFESPYMLPRP